METIGFPISREAACCGIYIYLGSTRVGMKSKDALRTDYLRMYEDNYRADLERRRSKKKQQRARDEEIPSPASVSEGVSASSFLSMLNSIPKVPEKPAIIIDVDFSTFDVGATWEEPIEERIVVKSTVADAPVDWTPHGVELFSIKVNISVKSVETKQHNDLWEDSDEDIWDGSDSDVWEDDSEEEEPIIKPNEPVQNIVDDSIWEDDDDTWVSDEDEEHEEPLTPVIEKPISQPKPASSVPKNQATYKPKTFAEVKNVPKVEPKPSPVLERLDENSIRDFVKSHKLCSESDILSAFAGYDKPKVRNVIKSALRKYKIFEKHGKYTV